MNHTDPDSQTMIKSFVDLEDAVQWLEYRLREARGIEPSYAEISFVNHQWRVGVTFEYD